MTITVSSGTTAIDLNASSGNPLVVLSGGIVEIATVLSGGTALLSAGGGIIDLTVSKGGVVDGPGDVAGAVEVFGSISRVTVTDATNGNELTLFSGATASNLTLSGEIANEVTLQVEGGASSTDGVFETGTLEVVYSGGAASGDIVQSGAMLLLGSGAIASDETVLSGATLAYGETLSSDFVLTSAPLLGAAQLGPVSVAAGATIELYGATVLSGVTVILGTGTASDDLTISAGGVALGPGQLAGLNFVAGSAVGVSVEGGQIMLLSGGFASGVTGYYDGVIDVAVGANATGTVLSSGSDLVVYGTATGTVANTSGVVTVYSGGVVSADIIAGGDEFVSSGGRAVSATVSSGGFEYAMFSGTITSTTVSSGGDVFVHSGGVASATTVLSGGEEHLYTGGVTFGDVAQSGGLEIISSGGVANAAAILSGGLEYLYTGGVASGTTLSGGDSLISSGATAVGLTVSSGGIDKVLYLGTASGTVVSLGGDEYVQSGGYASGTQVLSGGLQHVFSSGTAVATTVSSGGREVIYAGGVASGLTVLGDGDLVDNGYVSISGAGTLAANLSGNGVIAQSGAGDLLISGTGAMFDGYVTISGGTIELATSGAIGTAEVLFHEPATGSAVLQIDAADAPAANGTFANTIENFSGANEDIDLRSIAYVAGASAAIVGSDLVLTEGADTYTFKLTGTTAGAYPVLSDGHGGTLIDPTTAAAHKALDPKVLAFAHTLAAFAPADAANTALVSSTSPNALSLFAHAAASAGRV